MKTIKTTIPNKSNKKTDCLYIGRSSGDLVGRLKAHFGKPAKSTFALRLFDILGPVKEAGDLKKLKKIELSLQIVCFSQISDLALSFVEASIASKLNPAIGEHQEFE